MNTPWQIITGPYGLTVITPDKDVAWPDFFTAIEWDKHPAVIEYLANEIGVHSEVVGVNFPQGLAQSDLLGTPIPANNVEVYSPGLEDSIIPRSMFYAVLEAFAERLLASPDRPAAWYEAMRAALARLRAKMAADAAIG